MENPLENPQIPVVALRADDLPALVDAEPERAADLLACARRRYTTPVLMAGDAVSRRWLTRTGNPYLAEIAAVARRMEAPGAWLLNMSYEWSCSTGVAADPAGPGNRMLRTLDWPLEGLGRNVLVADVAAPAGRYCSVTWPGYVGITTVMAPGRFSLALNQPPFHGYTPSCHLDWVVNRFAVLRRDGLPPDHLLRRLADSCATYAEARRALIEAPLCIPALFTLSGLEPEACCIVERGATQTAVRDGPGTITNHWTAVDEPGHPRGIDSDARFAAMEHLRARPQTPFDWVRPPILNETTRLAVDANAARGTLAVAGYEFSRPATAILRL